MVHPSLVGPARAGAAFVSFALIALFAPPSPRAAADGQRSAMVAAPTAPSAPAIPSRYVPPVAGAVIVDHFRAPTTAYAAGNRGLDEITRPGAPVVASAAGEVIFAGSVAGELHVTLRHADGLRSSYSFLLAVSVRVGDRVEQGVPIGIAGSVFHFGIRDPMGTYLDPELLFGSVAGAHLVPGPDEGAVPLQLPERLASTERSALAAVVEAGRRISSHLTGRAAALGHEVLSVSTASLGDLAVDVVGWKEQLDDCTPASAAVPPRPPGRRIAVLVGGLGSTSDRAAVDRVDVPALGYAPTDVVRFSYRGGRIPGPPTGGALDALPSSAYGAVDSEIDLHRSADRLLTLLADVARLAPGVPIDLIAHSQGGVVVRLALARAATAPDPAPTLDAIGTVVTLGTPHQGADLATALAAVDARSMTGRGLGAAARAVGIDLDLTAPAVEQLAETSPVTHELARPVPEGVRLVSIGASGDLTVPDVRTIVAGSPHVTVHLTGPHAHDRLPADPATTREIGLAVAGAPPTCPEIAEGLTDLVTSHLIAQGEDALGLALATAGP